MGEGAERIRRLMKEGLDRYALGDAARAVALWREVLRLDPQSAEARDYLRAAEADVAEPAPERAGKTQPSAVVEEVLPLLRRGALVEAADLLEGAVGGDPEALDAHGYLELVRARLVDVYRARIGFGDGRPRVRVGGDDLKRFQLPAQAGFLLSLVDGATTVDELLALSSLDPFEALRCLASLVDAGILEPGR